MKLTIPCHWHWQTIDNLTKIENIKYPMAEIFGSLAKGGAIGPSRSPKSVVSVNKKQAVEFKKQIENLGLKFTYLLNAPFNLKNDKNSLVELDKYLDWVLNEFGAEAVTISSYELMKYVRQKNKKVDIHISTITGIQTCEELEKYLDIRPNRLVPHHNLGKDWKKLEKLVAFAKKNQISTEILANESCLYNCPLRSLHYQYVAKGKDDLLFHQRCNAQKLINPKEWLMAGGIIRPEDIQFYEQLGVEYIKIAGRSKSKEWLIKTVTAYEKGGYKGNLLDLLELRDCLKMNKLVFLDNSKLEGFIENLPQENLEERENYVKTWLYLIDFYGKLGYKFYVN